jgi:hypothetical protein
MGGVALAPWSGNGVDGGSGRYISIPWELGSRGNLHRNFSLLPRSWHLGKWKCTHATPSHLFIFFARTGRKNGKFCRWQIHGHGRAENGPTGWMGSHGYNHDRERTSSSLHSWWYLPRLSLQQAAQGLRSRVTGNPLRSRASLTLQFSFFKNRPHISYSRPRSLLEESLCRNPHC